MDEKRTDINAVDSFKCFLFSLVVPILFSAIYSFLIMILSVIFKIDYAVFTEHWLVKGLMWVLNSLAFLCVYLYYFKKKNLDFNKTINIKSNYNIASIAIIIGLGVILTFGFTNFINLTTHLFSLIGFNPDGDLPLKLNTVPNMLISMVLWAVIPAVCEELLYRGLIFNGLKNNFKAPYAILIGGALFMLMHGSLQQTIYQFILGCVLCTVYYYTKNIFYPMLLHFLNNAIAIFTAYLQNATNIDINVAFTNAWSYIWPILLMIVASATAVALIYVLKLTNKNKYEHVVETEHQVFTKEEKINLNIWWIISVAFGILLWIVNTVSYWIGLA